MTTNDAEVEVGDVVIINIPSNKLTDKQDMTFTIYGIVKKKKEGMFNEITIDGKGYSIGIDTYTRTEIDNAIAQAGAGGGQGGGSMKYITLPTGDRSTSWTKTVEGDFACNLIDYRELSHKSGLFTTCGSHIKEMVKDNPKDIKQVKALPHTIKTKYKQKIETNTAHAYGGTLGMSGIKEKRKLYINTHWYDIPKTPDEKHRVGEVKIAIFEDDYSTGTLQTNQHDIKTQSDTVDASLNYTPNTIGRYAIDLGTRDGGDAENYMVNLH